LPDVYTTKGEKEVSWFQDRPAMSLELIAASGAGPGSAIVDIGGGTSRLVASCFALQNAYTFKERAAVTVNHIKGCVIYPTLVGQENRCGEE
jgi:hypothetical protein